MPGDFKPYTPKDANFKINYFGEMDPDEIKELLIGDPDFLCMFLWDVKQNSLGVFVKTAIKEVKLQHFIVESDGATFRIRILNYDTQRFEETPSEEGESFEDVLVKYDKHITESIIQVQCSVSKDKSPDKLSDAEIDSRLLKLSYSDLLFPLPLIQDIGVYSLVDVMNNIADLLPYMNTPGYSEDIFKMMRTLDTWANSAHAHFDETTAGEGTLAITMAKKIVARFKLYQLLDFYGLPIKSVEPEKRINTLLDQAAELLKLALDTNNIEIITRVKERSESLMETIDSCKGVFWAANSSLFTSNFYKDFANGLQLAREKSAPTPPLAPISKKGKGLSDFANEYRHSISKLQCNDQIKTPFENLSPDNIPKDLEVDIKRIRDLLLTALTSSNQLISSSDASENQANFHRGISNALKDINRTIAISLSSPSQNPDDLEKIIEIGSSVSQAIDKVLETTKIANLESEPRIRLNKLISHAQELLESIEIVPPKDHS